MNRFYIIGKYFAGAVLFTGVIALNYYRASVFSYVPFLPSELLLVLSVVGVFICAYFMAQHEIDIDNLKYQFLTIATHKFRTPLTAIKWIIQSLGKEITREDKFNYLRQLDVSVNRIMEVVDILTGLARFDHKMQYAYETAWVRQMIDVALDKYVPSYKEKDIQFSITADPQIPLVIIDKRKIQFVIDTLFENAIRYSPKGSRIDVTLTVKEGYVIISVTDHGIGMSRSEMRQLFKRFWRSNDSKAAFPDGMGLSLAMVREIMRKHNGKVWAESKGKGKGSTFYLMLKITESKPKTLRLNKIDL
jgi:two-component system, OmpR family, sensor histidine kinase VicK